LIARQRLEVARLEAEIERAKLESSSLRERLRQLEDALREAEQQRGRPQAQIRAVPPRSEGWLHLRHSDRVGDDGSS
jgi:chromosome segregation ATPase